MQIELQPFDTLFVRDGKPFSMGEDVWANGVFPPPPSVVYGALRTAHFSNQLEDLQEAGGNNDISSSLRINQLLLTKEGKVFFPCPYDVVSSKTDPQNDKKEILKLQEARFPSSSPTRFMLASTKVEQPIESLGRKHFLGLTDFNDYLKGNEDISVWPHGYFFEREPKIGIQKDRNTGGAAEGKLYRVEMFRPKFGTGLYVDWSSDQNLKISTSGFLKLGGEGKAVNYTPHHSNAQVKMPDIHGNRFKVIFATPAVFENGWLPHGINSQTLEGNWLGQKVRILAAAFDHPIYLGGFRMRTKHQKGGPKPMHKAVPAGAVYYLEVQNGDAKEAASAFHGKCIADFGLDQEGFGLTYVGKI